MCHSKASKKVMHGLRENREYMAWDSQVTRLLRGCASVWHMSMRNTSPGPRATSVVTLRSHDAWMVQERVCACVEIIRHTDGLVELTKSHGRATGGPGGLGSRSQQVASSPTPGAFAHIRRTVFRPHPYRTMNSPALCNVCSTSC